MLCPWPEGFLLRAAAGIIGFLQSRGNRADVINANSCDSVGEDYALWLIIYLKSIRELGK
jgi:hypothetical protein